MLSKQINLFFENQSSFFLGVYCISSHIFCHWWFDTFLSPWTTKPCIIPCNCLLRYEGGKKPNLQHKYIRFLYKKHHMYWSKWLSLQYLMLKRELIVLHVISVYYPIQAVPNRKIDKKASTLELHTSKL